MKKSEIMQIIKEEVEVVLTNEEAIEMFDLDPAALLDEMMKVTADDLYLAEMFDTGSDTKESCAAKGFSWDEKEGKCGPAVPGLEEANRTPKGNITQATREKTATLSDDRFPIFDKESALAALKLRGHDTTAAERKKIINKAAEYAPEAAKKAREADNEKKD